MIDEADEEAMTLVQGHTSETVKRFYMKEDMREAAERVVTAHKKMYGESESLLKFPRVNPDDSAYEVVHIVSTSPSYNDSMILAKE